MKSGPKIAFVTDALPLIGGAEKAVFAALEAFPCADIFALVYNKEAFADTPIGRQRVTTSFLNNLPFARRHYRAFLPVMPAAIRRFDLRGYDVVVSFSYAVAHGARVPAGTRHLSYTYTPMRYAWRDLHMDGRLLHNPLTDWYLRKFRRWDMAAAANLHEIASISHAIAERVRIAYQRDARVIYPPVEIERFCPATHREDYYVVLSRLVAHKRIDLIVDAFSRLGVPLVVLGEGPGLAELRRRAAPHVKFLGHQPDAVVAETLGKARGLVCAAEEDFGIALVEAQAAGCPVLAYGKGGALETVQEMRTGLFFQEQSAESLIEGVERFERLQHSFKTEDLIANSLRFSKDRFKREFTEFIEGAS